MINGEYYIIAADDVWLSTERLLSKDQDFPPKLFSKKDAESCFNNLNHQYCYSLRENNKTIAEWSGNFYNFIRENILKTLKVKRVRVCLRGNYV